MVGEVMPLAETLRELREAAGLTQQALAMRAGLSMSAISQIEQGTNTDPRMRTLKALAKALGVSLDKLTEDVDPAQELPKPRRGRGKGK